MEQKTPIQFQSPHEFQGREHYVDALSCDVADLDYIVGKYGFSEKQQLQCGLNGCNHWHWHGFVIATKSGKETHCGQYCGAKAFGISWDELHAKFKKQEETRDRLQALQDIKSQADADLIRCKNLYEQCEPLSKRVQSTLKQIAREPLLNDQFDFTMRSDGRIFGEEERSAFMAGETGRGGSNMVVLTTIEGREAVKLCEKILSTLNYKVNQPLKELQNLQLEGLTPQQIKDALASLKELTSTMNEAENFVRQAVRFLDPRNLQKISLLIEQIPQRSRTERMRRIVASFGREQ